MSAIIIKAPAPFWDDNAFTKVFLAGSIEQGTAVDWQEAVTTAIGDIDDLTILNPRREVWDSTWVQDINNGPFNEQVTWELDAMSCADVVFLYFHPDTKAPVSLFELGWLSRSQKLVVCCPPGYWRRGNVQIVCARYNIKLYDTFEEAVAGLRKRLVGRNDPNAPLASITKS